MTQRVREQIIEAIEGWDPLGDTSRWPDDRFDALAAEVFRIQFEKNQPYRRFCEDRGVSPNHLRSHRDIPAVPTDVYKHVRLTTATASTRTFRTSGTTVGRRGAHHFETLDVYRASLVGPFARFCAPDVDQLRMLILAPSAEDLPDSSLSFMLQALVERFGDEQSGFFVSPGADGQLDVDVDAFARSVEHAESEQVPTMLLGTAFAFAEFFERSDMTVDLADGSRLMETGGFKGKSRQVTRGELYELFERRLGVPGWRCVSEYSMTELSSQAYTDDLWRCHRAGERRRRGVLQTPPWARVDIVDPLDFEPIDTPGQKGLIRWYDLANTESVLAVQTSDMGELVDGGGFRLLGRAPDAQLRGCSLTIEEIVDASHDEAR